VRHSTGVIDQAAAAAADRQPDDRRPPAATFCVWFRLALPIPPPSHPPRPTITRSIQSTCRRRGYILVVGVVAATECNGFGRRTHTHTHTHTHTMYMCNMRQCMCRRRRVTIGTRRRYATTTSMTTMGKREIIDRRRVLYCIIYVFV